ncbi:unnamed protein product [Camellia sinensis]
MTLIKGQGTYPLDSNEVQLSPPTLYVKTQWRQNHCLPAVSTSPPRMPRPILMMFWLSLSPPFQMTRAQYQAISNNQAAIQHLWLISGQTIRHIRITRRRHLTKLMPVNLSINMQLHFYKLTSTHTRSQASNGLISLALGFMMRHSRLGR